MGCGSSRSRDKQTAQEDGCHEDPLHQHLTDRQIHLVRDSWEIIQENMLEVGLEVYSNFFRTVENEILLLFPRVIRTEDGGDSLDVAEEMLKGHALRVMEGLGTIVSYLDEPAKLQTYLEYLGKQHYNSKVKARMLERLWPSMDESFKNSLGDVYLSGVRTAWRNLMEFVISKMSDAMTAEGSQHKTLVVNGNGSADAT